VSETGIYNINCTEGIEDMTNILRRNSTMFVLAAVAGFALAGTNPAQGSAGWIYGGTNCGNAGPNPQSSIVGCEHCCNDAATSGAMPPEEQSNCHAFCAQADFTPHCGICDGAAVVGTFVFNVFNVFNWFNF
ncbi:MAG: hypothetical protein JKY27_13760, partial [Magnetovibrio sp.]|nr:hypothetical protein [Magnetovibrio sp.]